MPCHFNSTSLCQVITNGYTCSFSLSMMVASTLRLIVIYLKDRPVGHGDLRMSKKILIICGVGREWSMGIERAQGWRRGRVRRVGVV